MVETTAGMDTESVLQCIELFAALSAHARRALAAAATVCCYEDGQLITLEGDADVPVFFVLSGVVRIFRTNLDGREQILILLAAGEAFNMPAAFVEQGLAPASAVAVGPVRVLSIENAAFRHAVSHTPEIALAVLRDFSRRLYHLTELTYDLGLRSVRARLARFLLTQAKGHDAAPARWTHQEMASRIGTVREVVSRTLRVLVDEGLIQIERHRVLILDPEALAREAET